MEQIQLRDVVDQLAEKVLMHQTLLDTIIPLLSIHNKKQEILKQKINEIILKINELSLKIDEKAKGLTHLITK